MTGNGYILTVFVFAPVGFSWKKQPAGANFINHPPFLFKPFSVVG